jgi:uncharacterized protein (TIGR01777 family)
MKILVTGSSGLVGSDLVPYLKKEGHEIKKLVRSAIVTEDGAICWDPQHCEVNPDDFEGYDVLINLAGENIASGRWTPEKKRKIKDSRVLGTHIICELLARLKDPPKLVINASAVGFYGNRDDELLHEGSSPGTGFLSEVCQEWEAATEPAEKRGIRVVKIRLGVVLSPKGGVLARLLTPFKWGVGGVVGSGKQYMSWIHIQDLAEAIEFIIDNETISGPVNLVAPEAVTNRKFTKTLGQVLHRPTIFPLPAPIARLALGEMADELLLSSTRVSPDVLLQHNFSFNYPTLKEALVNLIGKDKRT